MFKKIDIPAPPAFRQYDRYLLLNHPDIWASRIHIVLFYGGALLLVVMLHAFLRPLSLADLPEPDVHFFMAAIPSLLAFGPFAYHLSLFSVEKGFGFRVSGFGLRQQLSLAVSIALLALIPFLYASTISMRMAEQVSEQQLMHDITSLNVGDVYFPPYVYVFEDYKRGNGSYNYEMHKYKLYSYSPDHKGVKMQSIYDLKQLHMDPDLTRQERVGQVRDFIRAFNTYSDQKITIDAETAFSAFEAGNVPVRNIKASKTVIEKNLEKIMMARNHQYEFQQTRSRHNMAFFLMGLWVVMLLFLKMRKRDFALGAILAGALITIFSAGIYSLSDWLHIKEGNILFPLFMGLFVFLFAQSFRRRHSKFSNSWKSITLMWVTGMIPFFPLVLIAMGDYVRMETAYTLLYLGFALLLLVWNVFLNKRFTELLAQPTEN